MAERAVATAKTPEAKQKCSNSCKQNVGFNSSGPTADMILQLQRTAGNRAVQKLIKSGTLQAKSRTDQSSNKTKPAESQTEKTASSIRPNISPEVEASMHADVEFIVGKLKQQALWANEERQILQRIKKWSDEDQRYAQNNTGYQGSDYLDKFIFYLKMRTYIRRTARSSWVEQWFSAFDDLWYEIEDERLNEFKSIIARSKKQATAGPSIERMENAWSYVGKRELMGGTGILKAMGLAVTGVVDTAIWVRWKISGAPLRLVLKKVGVEVPENDPQISKYVDKSFDECADLLAQTMGVDLNEELFAGMSSYEFGATAGKVPAALMLGGALAKVGAAGQAIGVAQTAQQAEGLYDYVKELQDRGISWDEIVKDPQVWTQVVGVVSGAIGSAGGFAGAQSKAAQVLSKLNVAANTSQIGVMVAAYMVIEDDPNLSSAEKSKRKAELLADMINTGAMMINDRYGKDFEKAWAEKFSKKTSKDKLQAEKTKPLATDESKIIKMESPKGSQTSQTHEVSALTAEAPKEQKPQKLSKGSQEAKPLKAVPEKHTSETEEVAPELKFDLHIGEKRAEQTRSGERKFPIDRALTFDIDEVLPVGATDVKPQRAVARALDPYNRQLLDPNTNQRTKGLGIDFRELRKNRGELKPVSVVDNPGALITRRFSEVNELKRIFDRAVASIKEPQKLTPTELKARINKEMRRIVTEDQGSDAVAVRKALSSLGFEHQPGRGFTMTKEPQP